MTSPRPRSPFVRLALWTTGLTYALILVGGLVRASGAGLGCPDWPKCFGTWIPPASIEALPPEFDPAQFNPALMWTEYLNRLLGVTVGLFILATTISAWRHHRGHRHIFLPTLGALLLTGYEGWLGGRVVAHELAPWIVTAHLVVAIVIVLLLVYATVYAIYRLPGEGGEKRACPIVDNRRQVPAADGVGARVADDEHQTAPRTLLVRMVTATILVTLLQVAVGTQVRGRVDAALDRGVARGAALSTVGALDGVHRTSSLAVVSLALVSMLVAWAKHPRERRLLAWTHAVVTLCMVQLAIGLGLAYVALVPAGQVLHLSVSSLLMGALMVQLLVARWE